MQGSSFGDLFTVTTFGESHGKALGVIIDGTPAGIPLCEEDINKYLIRRRPGASKYSTQRNEEDKAEIYSGVFEGKTTGTPIMIMVFNKDQRSKDYSQIADVYRPGHADFTYDQKYGIRDYRGGGRSSARETIGRVCAGAIAIKALNELGISFFTYTKSISYIECKDEIYSLEDIDNDLYMPDKNAYEKACKLLDEQRNKLDSLGGVAKCKVMGVMPGLGSPVFDKLDARLSHAIMSIGAVKAIEFGAGVNASKLCGSENNDEFFVENGNIKKKTNNSGGILGGISDGSDIEILVHFKPTPSISSAQNTVDKYKNNKTIEIKGRHDPIVVPRALVVVESMVAITLFDELLKNMSSKMENVKKIYKNEN